MPELQQSNVVEITKRCKYCGEDKSLSEFSFNFNRKSRKRECKSCKNIYNKQYHKRNSKKLIYKATTHNLRRKYGMTREMRDAVLSAQDHRCAICKINLDGSKPKLRGCIDHCHVTGKVRGILCGTCNSAIGLLNDSEQNLLSAVSYLSKYRGV